MSILHVHLLFFTFYTTTTWGCLPTSTSTRNTLCGHSFSLSVLDWAWRDINSQMSHTYHNNRCYHDNHNNHCYHNDPGSDNRKRSFARSWVSSNGVVSIHLATRVWPKLWASQLHHLQISMEFQSSSDLETRSYFSYTTPSCLDLGLGIRPWAVE